MVQAGTFPRTHSAIRTSSGEAASAVAHAAIVYVFENVRIDQVERLLTSWTDGR